MGTPCACCETCQTILAPEFWKFLRDKKCRRVIKKFWAGPRR